MINNRKPWWALLFLLPCTPMMAQSTMAQTTQNPPDNQPVPSSEIVEPPSVHVFELKYANAKELEAALGKLFESNIKADQLVVVADNRSNRLIVRTSDDQLFLKVRELAQELDVQSPADRQPSPLSQMRAKNPILKSNLSSEQEKLRNIIRDSKLAGNDPTKVQWIRELLTSTVEREFAEQQEELRSELTKLRAKMESLESLLEKRDSQKAQICQKRVESLLSGQLQSGVLSAIQDSLASAPRTSADSMLSPRTSRRSVPLDSNTRISADNIADDITTILQAELIGEEGMQVILKGKPTSLSSSMLFQLDNRTGRVEYEVLSGDEKRMTVRVKLECQDGGKQFWERISGNNIRLSITQDEVERVTGGQLITKSVYLPKESGKGQATLISYEMEAGIDVREKAGQLGRPIVTMTLSRSSNSSTTDDTRGWQHCYGRSPEVQAYYQDLAEYCKLHAKLGPQDQKAKAVLNKLISNKATNDAIQECAAPNRTALLEHVAAQKALSSIDETESKEIGLLVHALSKLETVGRMEFEQTLQREQDSNSREVCFVNDSDHTAVFTVISGTERFDKRLKPHTHSFETLGTTFDDRVVLAQTIGEPSDSTKAPPMKVFQTKVLADRLDLRWNFCFVHGSEHESIRMDLLGYACLDIVPLKWHQDPLTEDFPRIKSQLIASLKSTAEEDSGSTGVLKKNLRFLGVK